MKKIVILLLTVIFLTGCGASESSVNETVDLNYDEAKEYNVTRMSDSILKSYSSNFLGNERLYFLIEIEGKYEADSCLTTSANFIFDSSTPYLVIEGNNYTFHLKDENQIDELLRTKK